MSIAGHIRQLGSETLIYGISGTIGRFISIFLVPLYTRASTRRPITVTSAFSWL